MVQHHFKQVRYWQTDRIEKVHEKEIVMHEKDWKMVRDYITILEGELHRATDRTFDSIRTEMIQIFGEEKVNRYYGKGK